MVWKLRLFWYGLDKVALAVALVLGAVVGALAIAASAVFVQRDAKAAAAREFDARSLECLALNVYYEARGESLAGQYAVAEVTMTALTKVKVARKGRDFSLLEVRLLTGRTHQIRVHLAHAGHPVLGDDKYGDFELNRELAAKGVKRLFLHAGWLAFTHPINGERLRLQAALPDDMAAFAARL